MDETTIYEFVPDVVESAAYDIVQPLLPELTLIYAGQNKTRPELPYATLQIIGRRNVGMPSIGAVDAEGVQVYHQVKEGSMSIGFFGGTARRHADNLVSRFSKQTSRDLMRSKSFFTSSQPHLMLINSMRDGVYVEPGAVVDVNWRYTAKFYDNAGLIEHLIVNGDIGGLPVDFEVNVTFIED